jgi:hypothetical protein
MSGDDDHVWFPGQPWALPLIWGAAALGLWLVSSVVPYVLADIPHMPVAQC